MEDLQLLPIHKYPQYSKDCCALINEEWPRSETARMLSLQASCDELPTCLVLLSAGEVVGHCKLTRIPAIPHSCFVESVVIKKALRGRKLGTHLMNKVEEYCKDFLHRSELHLSTTDQQLFYKKLGYQECAPVSIYGTFAGTSAPSALPSRASNVINLNPSRKDVVNNSAPPPPPLPPPPALKPVNGNFVNNTKKTYMMKNL